MANRIRDYNKLSEQQLMNLLSNTYKSEKKIAAEQKILERKIAANFAKKMAILAAINKKQTPKTPNKQTLNAMENCLKNGKNQKIYSDFKEIWNEASS